jgi:hypothetical protein
MDIDNASAAAIRELYENDAIPSLKLNICKEGTVRSSLLASNRSLRARQVPWSDSIAVFPTSRIPKEALNDDEGRLKAASKHFEQDQEVVIIQLKPFVESRAPFISRTFDIFSTLQKNPVSQTSQGEHSNISQSQLIIDIAPDVEDELYDDNHHVSAEHILTVSNIYRNEIKLQIKSLDRVINSSEINLFQDMHSIVINQHSQ